MPRNTRFYAAHFKLDLLEQAGKLLPPGVLLLLLDTDILAQRPLDPDVLRRCYRSGAGVFDISDQEFRLHGASRVIGDLEAVAGQRLKNPRWFGGECFLATPAYIEQLVPRARECFQRYKMAMGELNHNGDEAFISAAINLLADEGHEVIELGSYQMIGRHWAGNPYRDLRWFRGCSLLHLPVGKSMLERQAYSHDFSLNRIWRRLRWAHIGGTLARPIKRQLRARLRAHH